METGCSFISWQNNETQFVLIEHDRQKCEAVHILEKRHRRQSVLREIIVGQNQLISTRENYFSNVGEIDCTQGLK
jgi:hypothetical protein